MFSLISSALAIVTTLALLFAAMRMGGLIFAISAISVGAFWLRWHEIIEWPWLVIIALPFILLGGAGWIKRQVVLANERHVPNHSEPTDHAEDIQSSIEDDSSATAIETLKLFFQGQFAVAGSPLDRNRLRSKWALGYVFGALDCTLQAYGIVHESERGIHLCSLFIGTFLEIEPQQAREKFFQCVAMQEDPEFHAGVLVGGEEMSRAMDGEILGIISLGRYLATGKVTD